MAVTTRLPDGSPARPAVFLDKDGTLVENVPFNVDPDRIVLTRGARPALDALYRAGFALVVVSNQPGVALGRFQEEALAGVEARLRKLMSPTAFSAFLWCPHSGTEPRPCACRKPEPGLLLQAARQLGLDLRRSWMVGDILDDIQAGRAAGCRTILVDNGGETEWRLTNERSPDYRCRTLTGAAELILANRRPTSPPAGTVVARHVVGERW